MLVYLVILAVTKAAIGRRVPDGGLEQAMAGRRERVFEALGSEVSKRGGRTPVAGTRNPPPGSFFET